MSTLPGLASKGEKGKSRYQQLDINHLIRESRGETITQHATKSALPRKDGMQSLGKVPTARRPPNLPSLKAEASGGSDTTVALVPPSGGSVSTANQGATWGKSTAESTNTTTLTTATPTTPQNTTISPVKTNPSGLTPHQAAVALPVTNTILPPAKSNRVASGPQPSTNTTPQTESRTPYSTQQSHDNKSWSAVMTGSDLMGGGQPPPYQSAQFQHEFPSLSGNAGTVENAAPATGQKGGADIQYYGPGPSLRPQTEGSWMQGGCGTPSGGPEGGNLAQQGSAQAGHHMLPPPHQPFRGMANFFMYKDNVVKQNNGPSGSPMNQLTQQSGSFHSGNISLPSGNPLIGGVTPPLSAGGPRNSPAATRYTSSTQPRGPPPAAIDELAQRPIIKEEELSRMDDMTRDAGWATQDDIDYNQKLAFSDDETAPKKETTRQSSLPPKETEKHEPEKENRGWSSNRTQPQPTRRSNEDYEVWSARRNKPDDSRSVALAERAKQRKEEEQKREKEQRGAANKKLNELLDKKITEKKLDGKVYDETQGTINPASVPRQVINPVPIPVPGWEKDRESRERDSDQSVRERDTNSAPASDFRQFTTIESRNKVNEREIIPRNEVVRSERERDRDMREQRDTRVDNRNKGPSYSTSFQIPPRFQRKQNQTTSPSSVPKPPVSPPEDRWTQPQRRHRNDSDIEEDHREMRRDRYTPDDNRYRQNNMHRSYESQRKSGSSTDGRDFVKDNRDRYYDDYRYRDYDYDKRDSDHDRKDRFDDRSEKSLSTTYETDRRDYDRNDKDERHEKRRIHHQYDDRNIREDSRYRDDRPQRPDSRDSRASRESRHSRDSIRDLDTPREYSGSWADERAPFEEEKRKDSREERDRRVPGPITREKLEADELRNEKRNLQPQTLKRSTSGHSIDKKPEMKKIEEKKPPASDEDWVVTKKEPTPSREVESKAWADATPATPIVDPVEEPKPKIEPIEVKETEEKKEDIKEDKRNVRSSRGGRDNRNKWNSGGYAVYNRGWNGSGSRRPPPRVGSQRRDWKHTDSEMSGDDIEKEDRSPKPIRKLEKDEKNMEVKQEKRYEKTRYETPRTTRGDPIVPRGEPSRFGRGNFRPRGSGTTKQRMDGYGPPPSKSPFSSQYHIESDKEKKDEVSSDEINKTRNPSEPKTRNKHSDDYTASDNSETECDRKVNPQRQNSNNSTTSNNSNRSQSKRPTSYQGRSSNQTNRQNSSSNLRDKYQPKPKEDEPKPETEPTPKEDKPQEDFNKVEHEENYQNDLDGFQEVRNKKTVKPKEEKFIPPKKIEKEVNRKLNGPQMTHPSNIPPLMATHISQPKTQFDRLRPKTTVAPRFLKQRENHRKVHMQQGMCDVNEMNKLNQSENMYAVKDVGVAMSQANAWEKKMHESMNLQMDKCELDQQSGASSQRNSPNIDKNMKCVQNQDKSMLDGSTPPVNTLVFENKNFKSSPNVTSNDLAVKSKFNSHVKNPQRLDKNRTNKLEDGDLDNQTMLAFNKPISEMIDKKSDSIQLPLSFNKEESDMKLDFTFESDLAQLTDDKNKGLGGLPRSIHAMTIAQSTISPSTAELDHKIVSIKKLWEEKPMDHSGVNSEDPAFVPLDPATAFAKNTAGDESHEAYSPSPSHQPGNSNTNVCKVKPTQQPVPGNPTMPTVGPAVPHHLPPPPNGGHLTAAGNTGPPNTSHLGAGHPLSPPPVQVMGMGQPPQGYTTANQHINYQPTLPGNAQYGSMSAIPSPPTVPFNIPPHPSHGSLYGAFQLDQGRSQFSQFPPYGIGQTGTTPFNTPQSVYLQTAHPPPNAQPPPEVFPNLQSQYRMAATNPYGQSQQMNNNPNTVLITSSSNNSLMSPSVKPSSQQIGAIGTKAGVQTYGGQSQQAGVFVPFDPNLQASYIRGPGGPVQSNVVQGPIQSSNSYYSASAGGQTGFYQQPGNPAQPLHQHQTNFGLQTNVFSGSVHSGSSAGALQNFSNQLLSTPFITAAAMQSRYQGNVGGLVNPGVGAPNSQQQPSNQRPQQLKSPGGQSELLTVLANSVMQQHQQQNNRQTNMNMPVTGRTQQQMNPPGVPGAQNYPPPIQRPGSLQQTPAGMPGGNANQRGYRNAPAGNQPQQLNRVPQPVNTRQQPQYYGGNSSVTPSQEKSDDLKMNTNNNAPNMNMANKTNSSGGTSAVPSTDSAKDATTVREETNSKNE